MTSTNTKASADYLTKVRSRFTAAQAADPAKRTKAVEIAVNATGREYVKATDDGVTKGIGAAIATHYAYATGLVADGRAKSGEKGAGAMSAATYAGRFGLTSGAQVTRWRLLGRAIVHHGLDPMSDEARTHLSLMTREPVKAAIMAEKANPGAVRDALRAEVAKKKATPRKSAQTKKQADAAKTSVGQVATVWEALDHIRAAIKSGKLDSTALRTLQNGLSSAASDAGEAAKTAKPPVPAKAETPVVGKRTAKRVRKAQATTPAKQAEVA